MSTRPWVMAIDFGTSYTVAAGMVDGGAAEVIEVNGERRIPSVILVEGPGRIVVGRVADDLSGTNPQAVLRAPKSRLGDQAPAVVSGHPYQVVDLVAALLSQVYQDGIRYFGVAPREVRLTHPATWNRPRLLRLVEAAAKAGIANPVLVPEPVAAALAYWSRGDLPEGGHVAVYDLGGGTFDTAVVRAIDGGFLVVGRAGGDATVGGELFDEILANAIGEGLDPAVWEAIQIGDDAGWRQAGVVLRNEARRAKETLSAHPYADVLLPLPSGTAQRRVTRDEFEELIAPYVDETVSLLGRCIADAGLKPADLVAIQLVGGASRIPLVEQMVTAAYPDQPVHRRGDPKTAVAMGALLATGPSMTSVAAMGTGSTEDTPPRPGLTAPLAAALLSPPVSIPPAPVSIPPAPPAPVAPRTISSPPTSPPPGISPPPGTPPRPSARRRGPMIVAGALVGALAIGGAALLLTRGGDDATTDSPRTTTAAADDTTGDTTEDTTADTSVTTDSSGATDTSVITDSTDPPIDGSECPATDGSSPQITSFAAPPPYCLEAGHTYLAVFTTNKGTFEMSLDAAAAPNTVNNLVFLARYHYFDGTVCHRIIPSFVVQCGDHTGTGTGGPGYAFDDELPPDGSYAVGSVAMANSGPNTNGSQFFIVTGDDGVALPPLYSLFGFVDVGFDDTVRAMESAGSTDGTPTEEVRIESVDIKEGDGDATGPTPKPEGLVGLETMKGPSPPAPTTDEFDARIFATTAGVDEANSGYAAETYDALVIIALATQSAKTDGLVLADQIVNVVQDGKVCTTYSDCNKLLADGVDIDYDGASGPLPMSSAGDILTANYSVYEFGRDQVLDPGLTSSRTGSALAGFGVAGEAASGDRPGDGVLKVGALVPQTGSLASFGPAMTAGLELAVSDINAAGGVLGQPLELMTVDSGDSTTGLAAKLAEVLIENGVDAVVGPLTTGLVEQVIGPLTDAGITVVSPGAAADYLSSYPDHGLFFRTTPADSLEASVIADFVVEDANRSYAIVARDDEQGTALAEALKAYLDTHGVPLFDDIRFIPATDKADFADRAAALALLGPDAVIFIGFEEDVGVLQALDAAGLGPTRKSVYVWDGVLTDSFGEAFGGA